jgi:hypothetical protein
MIDHNAPKLDVRHNGYWVTLQGNQAEIWGSTDEDTPSFDGPLYLVPQLYPQLWAWLLDEGHVKPLV